MSNSTRIQTGLIFIYYSAPGYRSQQSPAPFSGSFITITITIHHTLGTKYTSYHILKVRYGGDFYNLLYLIIHSHKVHIHVHDLTSKTFEQLIGCQVQNLYLYISYINKILSTL